MSSEIASGHALEILDSRARSTASVTLTLSDGHTCTTGVPSEASTDSGEAVELRDGGTIRYGVDEECWHSTSTRLGVRTAVGNVNGPGFGAAFTTCSHRTWARGSASSWSRTEPAARPRQPHRSARCRGDREPERPHRRTVALRRWPAVTRCRAAAVTSTPNRPTKQRWPSRPKGAREQSAHGRSLALGRAGAQCCRRTCLRTKVGLGYLNPSWCGPAPRPASATSRPAPTPRRAGRLPPRRSGSARRAGSGPPPRPR